jgi:hemoglobin
VRNSLRRSVICSQTMNSPFQNRVSASPAAFDQLGGEPGLRRIIGDFIDRVFADRMIGFFFRHADKERIKEMEYQLAAEFLGGAAPYRGRPLDQVHRRHPIMGGHFARRKQILKETLDSHGVPEAIQSVWLQHTENLRSLITAQADSQCIAATPAAKGESS